MLASSFKITQVRPRYNTILENLSTHGNVLVDSCQFSNNGATTLAACIDSTATTTVQNCQFNTNAYPKFSANFPHVVRNCPGYNPIGNVSISVPASTVNFAVKSSDMTYYVTGGTVTSIKIGTVATGLTSGSFRVAAQQTFSITYSSVPTVSAFAE